MRSTVPTPKTSPLVMRRSIGILIQISAHFVLATSRLSLKERVSPQTMNSSVSSRHNDVLPTKWHWTFLKKRARNSFPLKCQKYRRGRCVLFLLLRLRQRLTTSPATDASISCQDRILETGLTRSELHALSLRSNTCELNAHVHCSFVRWK